MDASIEAVDCDILLKFKKFLVEEGENEISVSQSLIYSLSDTFGEWNGSNRVKAVIEISTGEVPTPPETGNDILLDSDGKKWMQYVVSDPDPDVVDGTRETMGVTFAASKKGEGCGPRLPW